VSRLRRTVDIVRAPLNESEKLSFKVELQRMDFIVAM